MVNVAQLVRALDCGSRGRGFESHLSPGRLKPVHCSVPAFFTYMALTACCYKPYEGKKTGLPEAAGFKRPVVTPPGDHRPNEVREVILSFEG